MDQYTLNDEQWNEVVSGCGKIMAVGDTMFFMDEGDIMLPAPLDIFHQFGAMVHRAGQQIQGIMNEAERDALEVVRAEREATKKAPITDPKTIESFKSGIRTLLKSVDHEKRAELLKELVDGEGTAEPEKNESPVDESEIDPRTTPEFKAGINKTMHEIIMINYEAMSPETREKVKADLAAFDQKLMEGVSQ